MNYLGIDPSTVSTGYAIINSQGKLLDRGVISPPKDLTDNEKMAYLYENLANIIAHHSVKTIGCEDQFNGPNVMTLIKIARTASVAMLLAAQNQIDLHMFYPASWRLLFHGNGKAKKVDTINLVNEMHALSLKGKDNDIADAIGIAHATLQKCQGGCTPIKK